MCNLEINVPCSAIEDSLHVQYKFDEPVKVIGAEFDREGDLVALQLVVDDGDSNKFNHIEEPTFADDMADSII